MEPKENNEFEDENNIFCDRPFEEVEDGYIDDRGFYTTPNGSFWDDDKNYFNHLGFDRHGGSYDKYGIYLPGHDYDEKTGLYKDQKELLKSDEKDEKTDNSIKTIENAIFKLREQEKKDEKTIKKYEQPVEESEESDDEDKSNLTYDEEDFKEAYQTVMDLEERILQSQKA